MLIHRLIYAVVWLNSYIDIRPIADTHTRAAPTSSLSDRPRMRPGDATAPSPRAPGDPHAIDARYSAAATAHTDAGLARRRPRNVLHSQDTAGNRYAVVGEPEILPVNCEL